MIKFILVIMTTIGISSCSFDDNSRYVIKDVSQPCDILLCTSDTTTFPSSVGIHIMGVVNGECTFEIENGANRYNTIRLKDTIDYLYENEWYEHKINLKYQPDRMITGDSIVIKYRIW